MIAVEIVPFYRELAANVISNIDMLQAVAESGRPDPKLPELSQALVLLRRVQQGKPLELTHGMRAFLRRAAAEAGISKAEAKDALSNPKSAGVCSEKSWSAGGGDGGGSNGHSCE